MPTVSFDTDGAAAIDDIVILGNSVVEEPAEPTKTGYTFGGWYSEDTFVTSYNFATLLQANKTIYAKFTINQYTATFLDDDSITELGSSTVDYLASAVAPEDPIREGYTFTGWDTDYSSMTEDITVTATYSINQYTITFDCQGGPGVNPITADYGTNVNLPNPPIWEGTSYSFGYWSLDPVVINPIFFWIDMPAENITLYAIWFDQ